MAPRTPKEETVRPEKYYTILVSENPMHDPAKGTEYFPVRMQGTRQEWDTCPECDGSGKDKEGKPCKACKGIGKVAVFEDCPSCEGEGKKKTDRGIHRCSNCGGQGFRPVEVNVSAEMYIPRGVEAHNIPDWAIAILRRAVETHYKFIKLNADDKETAMVPTRRLAYPFTIVREYDKPMTDKEIKAYQSV